MKSFKVIKIGIIVSVVTAIILVILWLYIFPTALINGTTHRVMLNNIISESHEFELDFDVTIPLCFYNNKLYAVNSQKARIEVIDSTGKVVQTIGKQGNGPSECKAIARTQVDDSGIYIFDRKGKKILKFTHEGTLCQSQIIDSLYRIIKIAQDQFIVQSTNILRNNGDDTSSVFYIFNISSKPVTSKQVFMKRLFASKDVETRSIVTDGDFVTTNKGSFFVTV
jgi:hypothetical protein